MCLSFSSLRAHNAIGMQTRFLSQGSTFTRADCCQLRQVWSTTKSGPDSRGSTIDLRIRSQSKLARVKQLPYSLTMSRHRTGSGTEEAGATLSIVDTKYYAWGAEVTIKNAGSGAQTCHIVATGNPFKVQGREIVVKRWGQYRRKRTQKNTPSIILLSKTGRPPS